MSLSNSLLLAVTAFTILLSSTPSASIPWSTFANLSGCHLGDRNPALPVLKNYLHHYGYLSDSANLTNDSFDEILEHALKTYQQNFNLESTGILDPLTIEQLATRRCSTPDIVNGTTSMASGKPHGRNLYTFLPGEPTWPSYKRHLRYAITSTSAVSIDRSALRRVFSRAFARWSARTMFTFAEVTSGAEADITIGFYNGDHGDGTAFDGVWGTLAHAFPPTDGRFHLDAAEDWVADEDVTEAGSEDAVDLESVAVHEIGHLLGLGHSSDKEAVMFPTIKTGTRKVELTRDDVRGVRSLYGSDRSYRRGGIRRFGTGGGW